MKFSPEAESLIASLRNVPDERSPARVRDIIPLDSAIEVILEKYKVGRISIEDQIMAQWRDIVGTQTAHRCRPYKILDGRTLIIITGNSTLRQELMFKKTDILKKIRTIPQCENVRELVVRAG